MRIRKHSNTDTDTDTDADADVSAGDDELFYCVVVCSPLDRDGADVTFRPGDICRASELCDPPHPGHWIPWPASTLEIRKAELALGPSVEAVAAIMARR